jgi:hypothetical protein
MNKNKSGIIQPINASEIAGVRGGESQTYSVSGTSITASGDYVDIQDLGDGFSVTSSSSSGSGSNYSSSNSYTSVRSSGGSSINLSSSNN